MKAGAMDLLARIKELVIEDRIILTEKAQNEMEADGLTRRDIRNAIVNAPAINKVLRSRNPRTGSAETLYVIKGVTYDGIFVYTKGKIDKAGNEEVYYVFISSKRSTD
jgi:hypothetical protein